MNTHKPPSKNPNRARQAKYEPRPFKKAWQAATRLQETICMGIQRSGPILLESNWEGISANKKQTRKTVCPKL